MALANGTNLGSYEILAPLGVGGMGEVYRARDLTLGREVAIKVLRPELAQEPDRLARFEREARLLASLNHPNIAILHGVDQSNGVRFLVMELVPGQTLAERLATGPLPVTESLDIGRQVASAMEAAHDQGIIHRDLKPGNVRLTPDGRVKVLDFGLAKAIESSPPMDPTQPTASYAATREGVILGTPTYMSPEQVRGRALDKRTDVWSFGCLLYEMLTGRQAFAGDTLSDTLAAVLEREPDWSALPAQTPTRVKHLLQRCLRKDLDRRLRDIGDARVELSETSEDASAFPGETTAATESLELVRSSPSSRREAGRHRRQLLLVSAAFLLGLLLVPCGGWLIITGKLGWKAQPTLKATPPRAGAEPPPPNSVAVIPFEFPEPGAIHAFCQTLAANITKRLAQDRKLRVTSQAKVREHLRQFETPDVRAIVRGKVRMEAAALVVEVELVDTASGRQLWGEVYREKLNFAGLDSTEEKLAKEIAEKVKEKMHEQADRPPS